MRKYEQPIQNESANRLAMLVHQRGLRSSDNVDNFKQIISKAMVETETFDPAHGIDDENMFSKSPDEWPEKLVKEVLEQLERKEASSGQDVQH